MKNERKKLAHSGNGCGEPHMLSLLAGSHFLRLARANKGLRSGIEKVLKRD